MGNVYVAGGTAGLLDGNQNAGAGDAFLVKYDANGNKLWTRQFGTPTGDGAAGLATDSVQNIYVAGSTWGGLDGNHNSGDYFGDGFLVKFDANGNTIWTRQFGTPLDDRADCVAIDGSGGVYVAGTTYGAFAGNQNAGRSDAFLARFTAER